MALIVEGEAHKLAVGMHQIPVGKIQWEPDLAAPIWPDMGKIKYH